MPAALPADRFYLWRDLFFNDFYGNLFKQEEDGIRLPMFPRTIERSTTVA